MEAVLHANSISTNLNQRFERQEEAMWLGETSRKSKKLTKQSSEFLEHLMGYPYSYFHGDKGLKPEQRVVHTLESLIEEHVNLPGDCIVRYRKLFCIRILNRNIYKIRHLKD